jgi:hypothetical protein
MAPRRLTEPIEPMTLGNMRENGAGTGPTVADIQAAAVAPFEDCEISNAWGHSLGVNTGASLRATIARVNLRRGTEHRGLEGTIDSVDVLAGRRS